MTNKTILAFAVWSFGSRVSRTDGTNTGWLGRHCSRSRRVFGPGELYVDLGPLDLTRRH